MTGSRTLKAARVRVPCSTSNLGAGYDTVGLALDRRLEVTFLPDDSGELSIERSGTLSRVSEGPDDDLVAGAMSGELRRYGVRPSGLLRMHSDAPIARGLGTSAAAVLAGFDLALAALDEPPRHDDAFALALRHEGHGDNAAPSLHGGLRAIARTADGPVIIGLSLSPEIGWAYAAPAARISTQEARSLLPKTVPHRLAAASLGRLVALLRGLAEGNPELLRIGVTDELHVPHRLALIPSAASAISAGIDAGAWAVTISGAGSGLIAMSPPEKAAAVAEAMHDVFDAGTSDPECVGFPVQPSSRGLERLPVEQGGAPPRAG